MLAVIYQNLGHLVVMLLLVGCSAFFSAAETAFFNLSRRQRKLLHKSDHKLQKIASNLVGKPGQMLSCLLFGNMTVNVLFFAIGSILTVRVRQQTDLTVAAITALLVLAVLLLFGEILPKSFAYANSRSVAITAALPVYLCMQIFRPILFVLRFLITEPVIRLSLGLPKPAKAVAPQEFIALIDRVRKRGLITADENRLLTEIIELGFLKVRHVMRPRVDMVACAVTDSNCNARRMMLSNHLTKIPVYAEKIDNIIGLVHLRQLLLNPEAPLDRLTEQVSFVPEQKRVESLLEFFRNTRTDMAVVVDEYGGIAGSVRLEDIVEELLGPIEIAGGVEPIRQTGPFQYRLSGNLAVHDWAEVFDIEIAETRFSTIGGLVTALLGKIPKSGDTACWKNLKFTVEQVHRHRIETLILTLEAIPANET